MSYKAKRWYKPKQHVNHSNNHRLSLLKIPEGNECKCFKTEKVGKNSYHYTTTFYQANRLFCSHTHQKTHAAHTHTQTHTGIQYTY